MSTEFFMSLRNKLGNEVHIESANYDETTNILNLNLMANKKSKEVEEIISNSILENIDDLKIEYNWKVKEIQQFDEEYIDKLIKYIIDTNSILKTTESSISFNEKDKTLIVCVPNIMVENVLIKESFKENIIKKVKLDCNTNINLKIEVNNNICFEEFIEKSRIQENTLCQNKLKENPINLDAEKTPSKKEEDFSIGKKIKNDPIKIEELNDETYWVTIMGHVYNIDVKPIKNNKYIVTFFIHDDTSASSCKAFWSEELYSRFDANVKEDDYVMVSGKYCMDSYANDYVLMIDSMTKAKEKIKIDKAAEKRVELRIHTQMSNLEGFVKVPELYKTLDSWGHTAIGITDLDVVQSFPAAMKESSKTGIKTLFGVDGNVIIDGLPIVKDYKETKNYVVFDIETTGLANQLDKITEIGAVKICNGEIVDRFSQLVNPEKIISEKIVNLTGITNEMVAKEPTIDEVLPKFLEFCEDSTLVAHNAEFDISNIRTNCKKLGLNFDFPYVDTLYLARFLLPELKNHKLGTLSKHLNVKLLNHHRAVDDAKATADIFIKMLAVLKMKNIKLDESINKGETDWDCAATAFFNILILARTQAGLKNLYKIISASHTQTLYKGPKIAIEFLKNHREGLLIGSGNINGRLYQAIFNDESEDVIKEIASFYDFLEVQPRSNFTHLVDNSNTRTGIPSIDYIDEVNKYIVNLGEELNIPVVATGDVYYLNKGDHIYREIVKSVQFKRKSNDSPNLYLKMTNDMIDEFSYLGNEKAKEIVVENTNNIANMIEEIRPVPKGKFPPKLEGAEEDLTNFTYEKAREIYGENLPEIVSTRLERELNSIIGNGYAALYMIARKLILKSNEDGYVVGSRGSVGSSLVATMSGITEVNPLAAHYICPNCKNSEFYVEENYDTGLDMPDKDCPKCGHRYKKDGHNIPFEVFLGFEGNKEPDIDLNFASEYQSKCHKYTEELFGKDYVFRAGTIGTIAENTAFGYIKKYYESIDEPISNAQVAYLQKGIVGTKRTTGQHPGGIMVIDHKNEMEDFTPISYPADDKSSNVLTTHFTYRAVDETILKLDLLGHDTPSIIRMLEDLTGFDPADIDLSDKKTMSIFSNQDALELKEEISEKNVGTLGIPEFGTNFVRQMLCDTRPTSMGELFRISGLSHGTEVWLTNAQDLINSGEAVLGEVICTRDDIMSFLISKGLDSNDAFLIMESVRKGRGLTDEQKEKMLKLDLPSWYIDSCLKIKYMFPKAHATAYVLMSFRIAYFKVHYPTAFYSTYFTTKLADFPGSIIFKGLEAVKAEMRRIKNLGYDSSNKENSQYDVLELAEEMYARGYEFEKPKLGICNKNTFTVSENNKIIPPYSAIDGVSAQHSIGLYEACKDGDFISIEDLVNRSGVNKTAIEGLKNAGLLDGLQETNQIDLFSML